MSYTVEQLEDPITEDEATAELVEVLDDAGFSARSWVSGSRQLTILKLAAHLYEKFADMVTSFVKFQFNQTSTGEALTRFSKSVYDNTRQPAVATKGPMELALEVGEGPYTIGVGEVVVSDGARTFRNLTGGTLNSGTTPLALTFEAEVPGADGNVANDTVTTMVTVLAGVTVNNPGASGSPWYTQQGVDEESDDALKLRNTTKWATLNPIAKPADGYINLALSANPAITQVKVDNNNPRGEGTIDVYIAGDSGALSAGGDEENDAQALIDQKHPPSQDPLVIVAPQLDVTITGTVYLTAAENTAANRATIEDALRAYVNGTGIGGLDLSPGPANIVPEDGIKDAIRNAVKVGGVPIVKNVDLTAPSADVAVGAYQIPNATTISLTYQGV